MCHIRNFLLIILLRIHIYTKAKENVFLFNKTPPHILKEESRSHLVTNVTNHWYDVAPPLCVAFAVKGLYPY